MHPNIRAFLDMLAVSEGTSHLGDNGYNVIVGGDLFHSYADHPRQLITLKHTDGSPILDRSGQPLKSTAAGRYQILERYYDAYRQQLGLPDFSPASQDAIAVQMITECHAIATIIAGQFDHAARQCASRWASLPGAGYNQHENDLAALRGIYQRAGGTVA